jgi:hypothetical protein
LDFIEKITRSATEAEEASASAQGFSYHGIDPPS